MSRLSDYFDSPRYSWASRSVYDPGQNSTNTTTLRRRDSSKAKFRVRVRGKYYHIIDAEGEEVDKDSEDAGNDEDDEADYEDIAVLQMSDTVLGAGGQGYVEKARLYQYDDPDNSDDTGGCENDWKPVAVKVSKGVTEYNNVPLLAKVKSPNIVTAYEYALKVKNRNGRKSYESVVAYELLDVSAKDAWYHERIEQAPFINGLMQGTMAAADQGIFIMDLKAENVMSRGAATGDNVEWVITDVGMIIQGEDYSQQTGYMGTLGYMPPGKNMIPVSRKNDGYSKILIPSNILEMMVSVIDRNMRSIYYPGRAQVFNLAIIFLYLQTGQYQEEKSADMTDLSEKIYGGRLRRTDYKWYWIALLAAYEKGKDSPSDIPLPSIYDTDKTYDGWRAWYERCLCNWEERYTNVFSAWRDLEPLLKNLNSG
ncbi:uncharacterized protein N7459_009287 [Penicillium hispanicum]|uniref:uncharacterized protein n=1 Tax=Penicillium hispanicum TaxID=1080232 RepID=UPI00253F9150|nr:uncharacterized protein N7459_009287 [Penicillium hispanicum]KAJ5569857.1 hypothetical protein N7459_009287 [Penicillium hispanicum]